MKYQVQKISIQLSLESQQTLDRKPVKN